MMRRQTYGSLLGILLALIACLGLPAAVPAAQAAPQDGAGPGEALTATQSLNAVEGPTSHFAFGRVVGQATPTATPTATPLPTSTPLPGTGTLQICKQLVTATLASATFTFTTPPGGPSIPSITVPANTTGPVCVTATNSFPPFDTGILPGTVSITEGTTTGFTLSSVTGGTLSGTTATASITTGQTTTVTFFNTPTTANTGTLVVCKQLEFTGPFGLNSGLGVNTGLGLNGLGINNGIGLNGLGINNGIGLNGLNPLSSIANTFTFTTPPGGPTIPSITIPAGQLGPICAAGVAVAPGTVAVTEVVPTGFILARVTGGTLSGTTATATITAGQTTTLTFVNDPAVNILPPPPPILPPPPLQFLPPPPPPLLPPPPIAPPAAAPMAPAALPEVPVIPEADSLFLVVSGLVALGGLVGLRNRRRRRDDEA